jgi:hypothetical protein
LTLQKLKRIQIKGGKVQIVNYIAIARVIQAVRERIVKIKNAKLLKVYASTQKLLTRNKMIWVKFSSWMKAMLKNREALRSSRNS